MKVTDWKAYLFGDMIAKHEISDTSEGFKHRVVIGAICGEWASWNFPATLKIDRRLFVGIADGRAVFPKCFEVIEGEAYG